GPVIDSDAKQSINRHIAHAAIDGRILKSLPVPKVGNFVAPTVIKVDGIADLQEEIFGPVLHVATFSADAIDSIVDDINAKKYGLTFGLHTRIDDRVEAITTRLNVGNMYINRNQIGAVVGSQPFGGEGLSGTGPKAGGPNYVKRFMTTANPTNDLSGMSNVAASLISRERLQAAIDALPNASKSALSVTDLPGPTGESNRLSTFARGAVLCLGPSLEDALEQAQIAAELGCSVLAVTPDNHESHANITFITGQLNLSDLEYIHGIQAVAFWGKHDDMQHARQALAARKGAILPLMYDTADMQQRCTLERHICIDTTAAGGNASLLAQSD
ncbi:MAG: aldehyde dehydrogenase family protein, partial [Leucothrix sp.]